MKQMVMNGATPFLPEEIMTNILKRLPVKSLMRFQCVCKHWKNLFKTPSFIADHLRHSTHHNPSLMFFQSYGDDPCQLRLLDCELQVRDVQKAPPFDCLPCESVNIIGSSNGLLCVAIGQSYKSFPSLLLWNPATRDLREVPRSRTMPSVVYNCFFGFGFSTFVNDYKIVAVYSDYNGTVCKAEVYSLGRDSWKEIEFENLENVEDVALFNVTVSTNGAIFWYGITPGEVEEEEEEEEEEVAAVEFEPVIVSFDMVTEVFNLLPFPLYDNPTFSLTVYEDKLAMLYDHGFMPRYINLLVMEVDVDSDSSGESESWSWTEKFTHSPVPQVLHPGIIWRDEIVVSVKSGLRMFNVITNECRSLDIPKHYFECKFLNYVESLVPVVNIHNIEEP